MGIAQVDISTYQLFKIDPETNIAAESGLFLRSGSMRVRQNFNGEEIPKENVQIISKQGYYLYLIIQDQFNKGEYAVLNGQKPIRQTVLTQDLYRDHR